MGNSVPLIDTSDLALAISEFQSVLPGWWFSVGTCSLTQDASCGPDHTGPDADLLKCREFDEGFHCDDPDGTLASSLRHVMRAAVSARATARIDGRSCDDGCQCAAMQEVRARMTLFRNSA